MSRKRSTPFSIFLEEFVDFMGVSREEARQEADYLWKNMSAEQHQPYIEKAKLLKRYSKKLGSSEMDVTMEDKLYSKNMWRHIRTTVSTPGPNVIHSIFHLIHMNMFCFPESQVSYPIEVGISQFSLQNGVISDDVYHCFINPDYSGRVKVNTEETPSRQISYSNNSSNLNHTFNQVIAYLFEKCGNAERLPPLFTFGNNVKPMRHFMRFWCINNGYDENFINIYNLDSLFYELNVAAFNIARSSAKYPIFSWNVAELNSDMYAYTPSIACTYHENLNAPILCNSLGIPCVQWLRNHGNISFLRRNIKKQFDPSN